jgi:predicted DNA-binding protein
MALSRFDVKTNFTLNDETYQYLQTLCEAMGMKQSQYLRFVLREKFIEYRRQQKMESRASA